MFVGATDGRQSGTASRRAYYGWAFHCLWGNSVIDRRTLVGAASGVLLTLPLAVEAQQATKIARIGYLSPNLATANPRLFEGFRQGMRDLGYVEGRNLLIEFRSAEGNPERLPAVAAELVALKVDVIVTAAGTLSALAAKQATQTISVVFVAVGEPVASGLVDNLARPGGNVTGLSLLFPELASKSLELLKQAVPGVSRLAVLWQTGALPERGARDLLKGMDAAAAALGVRLQVVQARGPEDFDRAFSDMAKERAEALNVPSTPVFSSGRKRLAELAAQNRMPTVFSFREYVDAGGLMSYGPDLADMSRHSATFVDRILNGANPGDLPVEQPTKFELVINLRTAKQLGLTIPQSLLARADEVMQ